MKCCLYDYARHLSCSGCQDHSLLSDTESDSEGDSDSNNEGESENGSESGNLGEGSVQDMRF